jgi:4-amino-4-deoxy-L-arabinose transferase-like glycosyltransferase
VRGLRRIHFTLAVLAALTASGYFARLGAAPPYLSIEEAAAIRQSYTLATTGRDLSGRPFPMYFAEPDDPAGRDPVWVYAGAALLKVAPFSEALMRTPSVVAGVANVVLMFVVARRFFGSERLGLLAAAFLAASPAHFINSRIATQQIAPVIFVLLWFLFVLRYLQSSSVRELFWAGLCLGFGMYSYVAAIVALPAYFTVMLVAVAQHHWRDGSSSAPVIGRAFAAAGGGLVVALVPMIVWHVWYPGRVAELVGYYTNHGYNTDLQASGGLSVQTVAARLDTWWNTFNPERLFVQGDSDLRYSTRQAGYLLGPFAVFLALGFTQLGRQGIPAVRWLIIGVLVAAPLPAVAANSFEVKRWLTVLPFLIVLCVMGVRRMTYGGTTRGYLAAGALCLLAVVQFTGFVRYYHREYGGAAAFYFRGNTKAAMREVLDSTHDPRCAFHDVRVAISTYWELYATLWNRPDFARQRNEVDIEDPRFTPPADCRHSSVVVLAERVFDNPALDERLQRDGWRHKPIQEPDGKALLVVYSRVFE